MNLTIRCRRLRAVGIAMLLIAVGFTWVNIAQVAFAYEESLDAGSRMLHNQSSKKYSRS